MMRATTGVLVTVALLTNLALAAPARAQGQVLTGDVRSACEAILCLAAPSCPSECAPSIKRYYSISAKKFKDTVRKRKNFLALCPKTDADIDKVVAESTQPWSDNPPLPIPPRAPRSASAKPEM